MGLCPLTLILLFASVLLSGIYTYWAQERDKRRQEEKREEEKG